MPVLSPTGVSSTEPLRAPVGAAGDLHSSAQAPRRDPRTEGSRVSISAAGREAFLESIQSSDDLPTQATADRIHQGIITYLYKAFRLERPNPQREQIEQFVGATARGLDRGLRDAAGLLLAFGARQEQLAAERAQTFERVREQVTEFAKAQLEETGGAGPTRSGDPDPTGT